MRFKKSITKKELIEKIGYKDKYLNNLTKLLDNCDSTDKKIMIYNRIIELSKELKILNKDLKSIVFKEYKEQITKPMKAN